jgi:hypothetical protein
MRPIRTVFRLAGSLSLGAALAVGTATAGGAAAPVRALRDAPAPLPAHVYAPYFETYLAGSVSTIAEQAGVKYLTLAFLQASHKDPCSLYWNGDAKDPISAGEYLSEIEQLRASGGDVIPSFGGYSADHGGTELADDCTSVPDIVADYEQLVTLYGVSRLDFDIESKSLGDTAGITRRNQAIAQLEAWAATNSHPLQVSFTMPVSPSGLTKSGVNVLANAIANGARVDVVNIMTFDYYDGTTDMRAAAIGAAEGTVAQLAKLYPGKSLAALYAMIGITLMPGIDDNPTKAEVTTLADAGALTRWATGHGIDTLSIWAIQRDNGGCPGTNGSNTCSGVAQRPWQFSHILNRFTS